MVATNRSCRHCRWTVTPTLTINPYGKWCASSVPLSPKWKEFADSSHFCKSVPCFKAIKLHLHNWTTSATVPHYTMWSICMTSIIQQKCETAECPSCDTTSVRINILFHNKVTHLPAKFFCSIVVQGTPYTYGGWPFSRHCEVLSDSLRHFYPFCVNHIMHILLSGFTNTL